MLKRSDLAGTQSTDYARLTGIAIVSLLIMRVIGLIISPLNLGPDEAQYWRWGQSFDWGYYSKPPVIAWLIGTFTALFGDSEWAVRLPVPFLHAGAAAALFSLARDMYDARTAMFAALGYALMPGVVLSSALMTTDGILLPLWSAALLLLWRLRMRPGSWKTAIGLGIAIGLGFLTKYAMVYFLIGLGLTCLTDRQTRAAIGSARGLLMAGVAGLLILPHIIWNGQNGFQTLGHTLDNTGWSGNLFNPENGLTFLVDQMGVAGPIGFIILIIAAFSALRRLDGAAKERWLLCFILPALVLILIQAVTSRAHGNWAVSAYPAGSVLLTAWLMRAAPWPRAGWFIAAALIFIAALFIPDMSLRLHLGVAAGLASLVLVFGALNHWTRTGLLYASLSLHTLTACVFFILMVGPAPWADAMKLGKAFKSARGWPETARAISALAEQHGAVAIIVDERQYWHGLDYYGQHGVIVPPIYSWQRHATPQSHAELNALPEGTHGPVLIASTHAHFRPRILADFTLVEGAGALNIPLYKNGARRFRLYIASGHAPQERTAAWEQKLSIEIEATRARAKTPNP